MPDTNEHKIGPRLRRYLEPDVIAGKSDPSGCTCWVDPASGRLLPTPADPGDEASTKDRYAQAFIEVVDSATAELVRRHPGVKDFVQVVDGYCTALVSLDQLKALTDHPGVLEVDGVRYCQPLLDNSVQSIHGWDGLSRNDPRRQTQGSGVVIGIADYGLDFRLKDFRDSKGNTRIKYFWDQSLDAKEVARLDAQDRPKDEPKKPPKKYGYGVEYSSKDIDAALSAADPFSVVRHQPLDANSDVSGHGTHVAGIAAGNGNTSDAQFPAGTYVGVAPGAWLVFVHLDRTAITSHIGSPQGTLANSINLAHAVAYCFEKADELNMPCVVNLSMGFHGGGHDGNMPVEWIIDALLQKSGRAVVVAAGNEHRGDKQPYYGGTVKPGQPVAIKWETGELETHDDGSEYEWGDPTPNELEIWYSKKSRLKVQLKAPDNESSGVVEPGPASCYRHPYSQGEEAIITSYERTTWDGDACIHIQLNPGGSSKKIRYGTWVVKLEATTVGEQEGEGGVRFDAWIERTLPMSVDSISQYRSRFRAYDGSKAITLTTPGTARHVITVASYDDKREGGPVSAFSSRGPTRDERNRKKPELAAPGEQIWSTNAGASQGNPARKPLQGTSMSAPHVTGVVARLLSRQNFLTADEICEILVNTATHPDGSRGWDRERGYGSVDAAAAMKILEDKLNT